MRLEIDIPEHHYNNIMALDSVSLGRVPYKGIIMYTINAIKHGKVLEQEPTTKNDLGVDREDAVERLNAIKQLIGYDKDSEIVKATQKSLDMAISALEHPERNVVAIVPCGDTVSRQAVIDVMMQKWGENFSGDDAMQESIDAIRVMPSVTPQEPRKGHWIKGYTFPDGAYWKCDKCNELIKVKIPMHYCNNCGADMREVEE